MTFLFFYTDAFYVICWWRFWESMQDVCMCMCMHTVGMCSVLPSVHMLKLYNSRSQQADDGGCQPHPAVSIAWWHIYSCALDCYCPQAPPANPSNINLQQVTPIVLVAYQHQRQQRDCTRCHALTATVTGSKSASKEIQAVTLTNPRQRWTNTQI